jgi:hypothetical protein
VRFFNTERRKIMKKLLLFAVLGLFVMGTATFLSQCSSKDDSESSVVSSRSYKGHSNDVDSNNFVNVYKATVGSRLDDCQTCHKYGTFTYVSKGATKTTQITACNYCHLIIHPDTSSGYIEAQPTSYNQTLNSYGLAYINAGRSKAAISKIGNDDSDGDGFTNSVEIADLKYPGDSASNPSQKTAPMKILKMDEVKAMTSHSEFLLANTSKQQYDDYATFKGVKIKDLLIAAGVDPTQAGITGVSIYAPDGFLVDFTIDKVNNAYPKGLYYAGLGTATLGSDCGFVNYPDVLPAGLTDGGAIPDEQWLMIAYERNGLAMEKAYLDVTSGKMNGEGPYRLVLPQANPGKPDRGTDYPASKWNCAGGNIYDYNSKIDHNAGSMTRGVIAVRINPLPAGYEDFDYRNGGWAYIENESIIVYGYGISGQ